MRIPAAHSLCLLLAFVLLLGLSESHNLKRKQHALSNEKDISKTIQKISLQKKELQPEIALRKLNLLIQY